MSSFLEYNVLFPKEKQQEIEHVKDEQLVIITGYFIFYKLCLYGVNFFLFNMFFFL